MVLIVPLVGPVLLPVTLPTSVPTRRRAAPSGAAAPTAPRDPAAAAPSVP
jgi:hypothetical protein